MHPLRVEWLRAVELGTETPDPPSGRAPGESLPVLRPRGIAHDDAELRRIKWKLHRFFAALWP